MLKKIPGMFLSFAIIMMFAVNLSLPVYAVNNPMVGQCISPWPSPQSNIDAIETRNGGRHVDLVSHWIEWTMPFSDLADECQAIYDNGSILELAWQPIIGGNAITNAQINAGTYDNYIRQYVRDIKTWGKTIYIRPMHELNGDWYGWSPGLNGNTNSSFINAFRRIVDIAKSEGATNIKWGYSIAQDNKGSNTFLGAYPGDSYVDYMSIDVYNWGTNHPEWPSSWISFESAVTPAYNAFSPKGKPIFISEYGSVENGGNKAQWITDAFNAVRNSGNFNLISAMAYFDLKPDVDDWRLTSSTSALNAYIAATDFSGSTPPAGDNLALNKAATASSTQGTGYEASKAFDGNAGTRWSADFTSDPQWIYVDLGSGQNINRVKLSWETAYASAYKIQISNDASSWTDVYSTAAGDGGSDDINFSAVNARYIRMYGTQRANAQYSYSLWEFEVYGSGGTAPGYSKLVNCGSSAAVDGCAGDQAFTTGGWGYVDSNTSTYSTTDTVSPDCGYPTAIKSNRYVNNGTTLTYKFTVPNGSYTVKLSFAEIYATYVLRKFNIVIEGSTKQSNFDMYTEAGGHDKGITKTFTGINVTDGVLQIDLVSTANNAQVNAIEVTKN